MCELLPTDLSSPSQPPVPAAPYSGGVSSDTAQSQPKNQGPQALSLGDQVETVTVL